MITLGIHDGHTATACLLEDGEVRACISEERLNRIKEWSGFPEQAAAMCLEITGKDPEEVDAIGICSLMPQIGTESWYEPQLYKKLFSYIVKVVPDNVVQRPQNIPLLQNLSGIFFKKRRQQITKKLSEMGFQTKNRFFLEHHSLHAATGYYTNWYKNDKDLVITLDGSGDAVCATVSVGKNGELERIAEVFFHNSICDFYTRVTQFLGMKPMSHEYKVMGMAPYAAEKKRSEILENFRNYYRISHHDPLQIINTSGLWKWQYMNEFKKKLVGERFDWIAGAVQDLFEEVVIEWVRNAMKSTGAEHIVLSGGGFMNVKLNYLISKLPDVRSLFVFPSCGDESNAIGASILAALRVGFPPGEISPLGMVYWGPSYNREEIEKAVNNRLLGANVEIERSENTSADVAQKIAEGKIVGRFSGRMEWGARALGNRSILADPRDLQVIHRINKAIKMRDFWMPFAPAILGEYRERYLDLREDFRCPFMTIAPDTKPEAWHDIPAGLHPFDKSSRAQVLDPQNHPGFYEIVKQFETISGVGGVLNTSFNLHGDPIVCSPDDAIDTFLRSELDILQLEDFIIEK